MEVASDCNHHPGSLEDLVEYGKIAGILLFVENPSYKVGGCLEERAEREWKKFICHCKFILPLMSASCCYGRVIQVKMETKVHLNY